MLIVPHSDDSVTVRVVKADERWFSRHPNRNGHIRRFVEGEDGGRHDAPPSKATAYTFVERLPSGGRMRRFLASHSDLRALNTDQTILAIFIAWQLHGDGFSIGDVVPGSPLAARIRTLAVGVDNLDFDGPFAEQVGRIIDPTSAMEART